MLNHKVRSGCFREFMYNKLVMKRLKRENIEKI